MIDARSVSSIYQNRRAVRRSFEVHARFVSLEPKSYHSDQLMQNFPSSHLLTSIYLLKKVHIRFFNNDCIHDVGRSRGIRLANQLELVDNGMPKP